MKVVFVDSADYRQAPALQAYFEEAYPFDHEYISRGVNEHYCVSYETDYLQQEDIDTSDVIVFADDYHYEAAKIRFLENLLDGSKQIYVLNFNDFDIIEDYMTKADTMLYQILTSNG